jgi:hypothetical protein
MIQENKAWFRYKKMTYLGEIASLEERECV